MESSQYRDLIAEPMMVRGAPFLVRGDGDAIIFMHKGATHIGVNDLYVYQKAEIAALGRGDFNLGITRVARRIDRGFRQGQNGTYRPYGRALEKIAKNLNLPR